MTKITNKLNELPIGASLLVLIYDINVKKSSVEVIDYMNETINDLENKYELSDITEIENIKNTREAYKYLGKSPSSYRNASEAMLRRIVKGNGLYHINNVVDIHNIISVKTGFSIGSYDLENLSEEIVWRSADKGEQYQGIGKNEINIEFLPTLYDEIGAFGNPTSDSQRAMIKNGKKRVMTVVYSFSEASELEEVATQFEKILDEFYGVSLDSRIII